MPTVGPYGGPRGGAVSYERDTPVHGLLEIKTRTVPMGGPMHLGLALQGHLAHKKTPFPLGPP